MNEYHITRLDDPEFETASLSMNAMAGEGWELVNGSAQVDADGHLRGHILYWRKARPEPMRPEAPSQAGRPAGRRTPPPLWQPDPEGG